MNQAVTVPAALSEGGYRSGKLWTALEFLFTQTVYCLSMRKDGGIEQAGKPKSVLVNKVKNER